MNNKNKTYKTWEDIRAKLFTPEEIAESDRRVAEIGKKIVAEKSKPNGETYAPRE